MGDTTVVPLTPQAIRYSIPEPPAGPPESTGTVYSFLGREINFIEFPGGINSQISDRLSISPFQISVVSDDDPNGLPRRTSATLIPAAALEKFLPFSIDATSDAEDDVGSHFATVSDLMTITLGSYGPGTGVTAFNGTIMDPTPSPPFSSDLPDGGPLVFTINPMDFDVEEPAVNGGGGQTRLMISDQVDILTPITVTLISSDNANLPAANGRVIEDRFSLANVVTYSLAFTSDTDVPEPASIALLGIGLMSVGLIGRRPCCQK